MAKTLLFLGEEGQKYALPSVFTDGYSLVSGDIFDCEDDTLADALLLETGRRGGPLFAETSDPATVFPPLVVVPPTGGGFSAEAEQLSEEVVSIDSKAQSGTDFVSYKFVASMTPYGAYTHPVAVREMSASESGIAGYIDGATGTLYEALGRGTYKHEVSTENTADTGGVFAVSEATDFGLTYSYTAELNYNHPVDMANGITSSWNVYLSSGAAATFALNATHGGGTVEAETRAYHAGGYEVFAGAYVRDETGTAMVMSHMHLSAENDNDSTMFGVVVGAMDSDGQTDIRQAAILLENVDRLLLTGAPKGVGTDTPTLGATAPVAGLQIVEWLTLTVDGQPRYLPLFGVPI